MLILKLFITILVELGMTYNEFEKLLEAASIGKTEFASINKLNKHSVFNWKQKEVPGWVRPWLENYIKGKAFEHVLETAEKIKQEIK